MLFHPDGKGAVAQIYWYVTAVLAAKFGVEIHAVQVLSTHFHEVLTDVRGLLPLFLRERNRLFANVLKCHLQWPEEVFQRAPASYVELHGADAIAAKIAYTLANCVEAGLVHEPGDWPGVTVTATDIGHRTVHACRPEVYFRRSNPGWPDRAAVAIRMPAQIIQQHGHRASAVVQRYVAAAVAAAHRAAATARRCVGNESHLAGRSAHDRATTREPRGGRNPTFATGGKRDLSTLAAAGIRAFRSRYRDALAALKRGDFAVEFPSGSWRWCRELLPASLTLRRDGAAAARIVPVSATDGRRRGPPPGRPEASPEHEARVDVSAAREIG